MKAKKPDPLADAIREKDAAIEAHKRELERRLAAEAKLRAVEAKLATASATLGFVYSSLRGYSGMAEDCRNAIGRTLTQIRAGTQDAAERRVQ